MAPVEYKICLQLTQGLDHCVNTEKNIHGPYLVNQVLDRFGKAKTKRNIIYGYYQDTIYHKGAVG